VILDTLQGVVSCRIAYWLKSAAKSHAYHAPCSGCHTLVAPGKLTNFRSRTVSCGEVDFAKMFVSGFPEKTILLSGKRVPTSPFVESEIFQMLSVLP